MATLGRVRGRGPKLALGGVGVADGWRTYTLFSKPIHITVQDLHKAGVDFTKYGEDEVTDLVAFVVVEGVCSIFPPLEAVFCCKGLNVFTGHAKKRPQKGNIGKIRIRDKAAGFHADDSTDSGAAE